MKNSSRILTFICLLISNHCFAQQHFISRLDGSKIAEKDIDRTVEDLMVRAKVPGMGLANSMIRKWLTLKLMGIKMK